MQLNVYYAAGLQDDCVAAIRKTIMLWEKGA